ncbi:hypothetical protein P9112_002362 [Eukaryota sp. TZLM1-RC]
MTSLTSFAQNSLQERVFHHFQWICAIPHESGNCVHLNDKIENLVKSFSSNIKTFRDDVGNVLITKPATAGHEESPVTMLQAHVDMVAVNDENTPIDFSKDPIQTSIQGDLLKAQGTSLGADNGMGVAMAIAILESNDLEHPPLEVLLTVDEETDMSGAERCSVPFKSSIIINLDSEEEHALCIGSSGGSESVVTLPLSFKQVSNMKKLEIVLKNLKSGHSGVNIDEQRANAIKLMARLTSFAHSATKKSFRISKFAAGRARNVIPAQATVELVVEETESWKRAFTDCFADIKQEFTVIDPDMQLIVSETNISQEITVIDDNDSLKMIDLLNSIPHGVIKLNPEIPGAVLTSNNLALANIVDNQFVIELFARSSVDSEMDAFELQVESLARLAGAKADVRGNRFSGWNPQPSSLIVQTLSRVHDSMFGFVPKIYSIHAGLECSILMALQPERDIMAVSIGPTIRFPHSVNEECDIPSVGRTMDLLVKALSLL